MVHFKHILQQRNGGKKPVTQWYQSFGSRPWDLPSAQNHGGFYSGKYLLRETPTRLYQWNARKKSISPKGKEMLVKKVLENQNFNESKEKGKQKLEEVKTKKDRRSKCYICREKGHAFWACESRKKIAAAESNQDLITSQILDEEVKFPEKVHVIGDYMVDGSSLKSWNEVWYISNQYKFHLCPRRKLFKKIKYSFKMIGKEETEKKFIFSYGLGTVAVDTDQGVIEIPNVQYTPEVTLNILSYDLLEEQGYLVKIDNTKGRIRYMFEEERVGKEKDDGTEISDQTLGHKRAMTEHNKYLQDYFESIDPKEECSLIKGLEDLTCDQNDVHDYVDADYISWNGTLYSLKVNSFNRFLSFINLIKRDAIVYKNWDVFSNKYNDMVKWFYLEYLNYESLENVPPSINNIKIDLLALHKLVDSLGGYVAVSLNGKWSTVAYIQGLTTDEGDTIKECFKKYIDLIIMYHDTAQIPWTNRRPENEVGECSWTAEQGNSHGWNVADKDGQTQNMLGVRNEEQKEDETSNEDSDFEVIV